MRTVLLLLALASPASAGQFFLEHLTDGTQNNMPGDTPTDMAVATLTIVPHAGGTPVVWNIGSVPTETTPISTRRRTLTPVNAAAAGIDWNLAEQYFLADAPQIDLIERIQMGPLVAQTTRSSWGSDPQYNLFFPGSHLNEIRFELTAMGTDLLPSGLRNAYVGGTFRYAVEAPEPSAIVLVLLAFVHCLWGRRTWCSVSKSIV
jgi:hypothetical protein